MNPLKTCSIISKSAINEFPKNYSQILTSQFVGNFEKMVCREIPKYKNNSRNIYPLSFSKDGDIKKIEYWTFALKRADFPTTLIDSLSFVHISQ